MANYSNDPRWIFAKFPGKCTKCQEPFLKGVSVFYYPLHKEIFYGKCAEAASNDFKSSVEDEDFTNSQF